MIPGGQKDRANETGAIGETLALSAIERQGYQVAKCPHNSPHDLVVGGYVTVEVKTAHPTKGARGHGRRWQFCLYSHPERGARPFAQDMLLLCCLPPRADGRPVFYVIPGGQVPPGLTKLDITSKPGQYTGKWARYREAWQLVWELIEDLATRGLPPEPEIPF